MNACPSPLLYGNKRAIEVVEESLDVDLDDLASVNTRRSMSLLDYYQPIVRTLE